MRTILVICFVLFGCTKKRPSTDETVITSLAESMEMMCRCQDAACAAKVAEDLDYRVSRLPKGYMPSKQALAKIAPISEGYQSCWNAAMKVIESTAPPPPPPPPQWRDALTRVTALQQKMCTCKDRVCAQVVTAELARVEKELEGVEVTEDDPKQLHLAYLATLRCAMKAGTGFGLAELPE